MFVEKDRSLPDYWRNNPVIARTVLLMSSRLEIGKIEALKIHSRGYKLEEDNRDIAVLQDFFNELQENENADLGEGIAGKR